MAKTGGWGGNAKPMCTDTAATSDLPLLTPTSHPQDYEAALSKLPLPADIRSRLAAEMEHAPWSWGGLRWRGPWGSCDCTLRVFTPQEMWSLCSWGG